MYDDELSLCVSVLKRVIFYVSTVHMNSGGFWGFFFLEKFKSKREENYLAAEAG